jgi:hypothetical protein
MLKPDEMYDGCTVMPNEGSLLLGMVASGFFTLAFWAAGGAWRWVAVVVLLVFVSCLYHLYWPSPMIRATREGLYLGIGTLGRSFYIPWERVDAVVLTKVPAFGPESGAPRDALGFVIHQDDGFKLPTVRWNCAAEDVQGTPSDVRFESSMIQGDVKTWVSKLEAFRRDVRHLPV